MLKKNIIITDSLVVALIVIVAIVLVTPDKSGSEEVIQVVEQEISEEAWAYNKRGLDYYNEAKFKLEAKAKFDEAVVKYQEAESEFKRAIEIFPDYAEAHANLARLYHFQKRYAEEAKEYEIVVNLRPDNMEARTDLAGAYAAIGRHDDAIQQMQTAIDLAPDETTKEILRQIIEGLEEDKNQF